MTADNSDNSDIICKSRRDEIWIVSYITFIRVISDIRGSEEVLIITLLPLPFSLSLTQKATVKKKFG